MANGKPGRPAKYSPEFKANAVDYVLSTGKTYAAAAADLGVPERTLGKWVQARRLSEPERAAASIAQSLEELRTDYVDLLLVHWPLPTLYGGDVALPWPALEEAFNTGGARAIGLSNYEREHVEAVRAVATVAPHVLQVEAHPFFPNANLRAYAQGLGMVFEAWSPLARGRAVTDPTLVEIGAHIGVGPTQVALRWALDRGHVVFPKTLSPARMATNFDVFSFALDPEQTARIDALDAGEAGRMGSHPATMDRL